MQVRPEPVEGGRAGGEGIDGMDMSHRCLHTIEGSLALASSPLALALGRVRDLTGRRGVCLLIEHEELGQTLIADAEWSRGRDETLAGSSDLAVVDQSGAESFRRIAVLVDPNGSATPDDICAVTFAALDVVTALAAITATFVPVGRSAPAPNPALSPLRAGDPR
jgi:phage terminase large subunit-like protein